jgi:hypothetical protein
MLVRGVWPALLHARCSVLHVTLSVMRTHNYLPYPCVYMSLFSLRQEHLSITSTVDEDVWSRTGGMAPGVASALVLVLDGRREWFHCSSTSWKGVSLIRHHIAHTSRSYRPHRPQGRSTYWRRAITTSSLQLSQGTVHPTRQ